MFFGWTEEKFRGITDAKESGSPKKGKQSSIKKRMPHPCKKKGNARGRKNKDDNESQGGKTKMPVRLNAPHWPGYSRGPEINRGQRVYRKKKKNRTVPDLGGGLTPTTPVLYGKASKGRTGGPRPRPRKAWKRRHPEKPKRKLTPTGRRETVAEAAQTTQLVTKRAGPFNVLNQNPERQTQPSVFQRTDSS